jgi:hypothetical protein
LIRKIVRNLTYPVRNEKGEEYFLMIELGNKAKKSIQVMISIGFVVEEQDDEENINYVINDDEQNIN